MNQNFIKTFLQKIVPIVIAVLCIGIPSYADNYWTFSGFFVSPQDMEVTSSKGITNEAITGSGSEIDMNSEPGLALAVGIEYESGFRVGLEYAYRSMDMEKAVSDTLDANLRGEVTINSWLVNFGYNFNTFSELTPYVGLGLGLAFNEGSLLKIAGVNTGFADKKNTGFAYQIFLGSYYQFTEGVEVGLGYRFFDAGEPDFDFLKGGVGTHNFELSFRYNHPFLELDF